MICHYCGADHAEDIVCQPMRQVMDDARAGSERPSSSEQQWPEVGAKQLCEHGVWRARDYCWSCEQSPSSKEKEERPTIKELEWLLAAPDDYFKVEIQTNGEIRAVAGPRLLALLPSARGALPKEPPVELLVSMALRVNHGFGLDDERSKEVQLSDMRKVYEEVSGYGFYSDAVKDRYTAMLGVSSGSEREGK